MKLTDNYLTEKNAWEKADIRLPKYDKEVLIAKTEESPKWLHFGAGNIFRAFPCRVAQTLINEKKIDTGIIVGEGFDFEIIEKAYHPFNNNSLLVKLKADASVDMEFVASVTHAFRADPSFAAEWQAIQAVVQNPSLQLISFTITEKGYAVKQANGDFIPSVAADVQKPMIEAKNFLCKLVHLLNARFKQNATPIALVSMDNCSHNGDLLKAAVLAIANAYAEQGQAEKDFVAYLEKKVSYPLSMIDKITPRPDAKIASYLKEIGFEDTETIITKFNTYTAPFVNAEETEYLVIEDDFPNGRPDLDTDGIYFADRTIVEKSEKMKVGTCLNPLHTALAVLGCLLGYEKISDEMENKDLVKLISLIGYQEGLPVVVDPKILDPKEFIDQVIQHRLPNPYMPDTPQRIATDTSQKMGVRFMETIRLYGERSDLDVKSLKGIPFVIAAWIRYLLELNDQGEAFEMSPDPYADQLKTKLQNISLGSEESAIRNAVKSILEMTEIFTLDVYATGLGTRIEDYVVAMAHEKGAVARLLNEIAGGYNK